MVASRWKDNTFKAPRSQKARVLIVRGSATSATFVPQNASRPMRSRREPPVIPRRESFAQRKKALVSIDFVRSGSVRATIGHCMNALRPMRWSAEFASNSTRASAAHWQNAYAPMRVTE
jgi:hypothetical protein